MSSWIALGLLIISALILVLYHDQGTIAGLQSSNFAGLMASVALLIWIGSSVLRDYSGKYGRALKDLTTWTGITLILVTLYTFRIELMEGSERVLQQLMPAGTNISLSPYNNERATVRIRKKNNGHFIINTLTNNKPLTMLLDTGASTVVLSANDARAIGIDTTKLRYVIPVDTANGKTLAARITIKSLAVGPIKLRRIEALVAGEGDLRESLLGMSFLNRLRSYEVTGDFLVLRS